MERVLGGLLILGSACILAMERLALCIGDPHANMSHTKSITETPVDGMLVVLLEYRPAFFICDFLVRI